MSFEEKMQLADPQERRRLETLLLTGIDHPTIHHLLKTPVATLDKEGFEVIMVSAESKLYENPN